METTEVCKLITSVKIPEFPHNLKINLFSTFVQLIVIKIVLLYNKDNKIKML